MAASVEYVNANPQAQSRVRTTAGAIGYVGLGFLEGVKALTIDGVMPDAADDRQRHVSGEPSAVPVHQRLSQARLGGPQVRAPSI